MGCYPHSRILSREDGTSPAKTGRDIIPRRWDVIPRRRDEWGERAIRDKICSFIEFFFGK